jgi:phosphatidylglycerol lysyltransferase
MTATMAPPDPAERFIERPAPLSSFIGDDVQEVLELSHGRTGYVTHGRWAIMPTDPVIDGGTMDDAVRETLGSLGSMRLKPIVVATEIPDAWDRHGLHLTPIAEDARVALDGFTLAGKRLSKIRHAVSSAERARMSIEPFHTGLEEGVDEVSRSWLATKRGGELRLTLGRLDIARLEASDCRVALDVNGRVVGFVTWRRYGDDGCVLDMMRRLPNAPNPTMDALIAHSLLEMRDQSVREASLNAVPLSHGPLGEHIYPTRSLRAYKEKFAPVWVPQWMATPSRLLRLPAVLAVVKAYSPGGVTRALRRNHPVAVP